MIVAEKNLDLEQSGMGRTVQAKIKASRKLFNFFSDGVYSNKPVAIARELVANAIDSHVMAGRPNVPVEVTLPTALDPMFIVQDFGLGMSEDFLFDKYLVYAEGSTKDGANEAIGGFGIGKAAVFSYTDQFSLVSIQDGVRGVYSVFVGEDGIPAISQIAVTTTDDHNGVTISFPVNDGDIELFHEAAQTALQFFTPLPTIHHGTVTPPEYSFVGNKWALRKDAGELGVILGGVRYPVSSSSLTRDLQNDTTLKPLLNYGIDLTMDIGSVGIALSREALSYDDRTSKNIGVALRGIFDDVKKTFGTMFDNEPTQWAAAKKLFVETGSTSVHSRNARQQLLAANAVYKGKKLVTQLDISQITGGRVWMVPPKNNWGRQASVKTAKWESFNDTRIIVPGQIETVVIDNMPASPKSKLPSRFREFLENAPRKDSILIVQPNKSSDLTKPPTQVQIDNLITALGGPEVKFTSDLPLPAAAVKAAKVANVRPKVRLFTWNGAKMPYTNNDVTNLSPAAGKPVKEVKYVDQPDTGILVEMSNFEIPKGVREKLASGVIDYNEVYYANKIDADKLDKFTKFDVEWDKRIKVALAKLPKDLGERLALDDNGVLAEVFMRIKHIRATNPDFRYKLTKSQRVSPFGQILDLWEDKVRTIEQKDRRFAPFLKVALPSSLDVAKLMSEVKKDQSEALLVLNLLKDVGRYTYSEKLGKQHIDLLLKVL